MKKLILPTIMSVLCLWGQAQNGTQPDSSRVIVGSMVVRIVDVLSNDNLNSSKTYTLVSTYNSTTSPSIITAVVGSQVSYKDPQGTASADTFFYVVKDVVSNTFDTNYVVVRKSNLNFDLYPGDANKDNICNNLDVLNIGAAMGKSGSIREGIFLTNLWQVVKAYDWSQIDFTSNNRYSDANGDGTIDSSGDVGTISQNYNLSNPNALPIYSPLGGSSFSINTPDTFKVVGSSTHFQIGISLGVNSSSISSCYGVAFTIQYDPSIFKSNFISFAPDKWFADLHNTLNFSKINATKGEIDVAIVRRDGHNNSGGGELGIVDVVVEDVLGGLAGGVKTNFQISKIVLVDSFLNKLPVSIATPKDVVLVKKSTNSINTLDKKELNIYQSNDNLIIDFNKGIVDKLSIYNILGEEVYFSNMLYNQQRHDINIQSWSRGIYLVKIDNMVRKIVLK